MKGFTLIELAVVISVMGIMAAVTAPRLMTSEAFDTRGQYGMLLAGLRYAQKTAIAQHRTVYVQVDSVNKRLKLCYTNTCDTLLQDPVSGGSYNLALNAKAVVTASLTTLGFTADGTPTPNMAATYTIANSKNLTQSSTILVEANTGYVHKQ